MGSAVCPIARRGATNTPVATKTMPIRISPFRKARQVFALKPFVFHVFGAEVRVRDLGDEMGVNRVDDDDLHRTEPSELSLVPPVVGELQEAPAIRVELRLDRLIRALLDPGLEMRISGVACRGGEVEVPGAAGLLVGVLHALFSDEPC